MDAVELFVRGCTDQMRETVGRAYRQQRSIRRVIKEEMA